MLSGKFLLQTTATTIYTKLKNLETFDKTKYIFPPFKIKIQNIIIERLLAKKKERDFSF
jgi:hypothetical protein